MPSHLGFIFGSIFDRFLLPTSIPWTLKIMVFLKEIVFQKIALRSWHRCFFRFFGRPGPVLARFGLDLGRSGVRFWMVFGFDFGRCWGIFWKFLMTGLSIRSAGVWFWMGWWGYAKRKELPKKCEKRSQAEVWRRRRQWRTPAAHPRSRQKNISFWPMGSGSQLWPNRTISWGSKSVCPVIVLTLLLINFYKF